MNIISYTIELKSDAQTGSGFGGESVNNYVTRDCSGNPVVHASHIKGLLRQTLRDIFGDLQWDRGMIDQALGLPGSPPPVPGGQDKSASAGEESGFVFSDACADRAAKSGQPMTRVITRTALDAGTGRVKSGALRAQEAVSAGQKFHGKIVPRSGVNPNADLLLRLALLSLRAIGGGRNRGSGCCVATIQGEGRAPGQLLLEIANLRRPIAPPAAVLTPRPAATTQTAWFDVCFFADESVLCPERPDVLNEIHSGISIPASAVRGLILHTLNAMNPEIAAQCFADPRFRAWPLNPCGPADMDRRNLPWPVRVSITHKTAKIISDPPREGIDFADEAIEPYDWEKSPANAPILKSSDGVLLAGSDGKISLWKANDMPRVFSVHGVHSDPNTRGGRNIFSVQAMGALAWRGLVACPAELAAMLRDRLHERPVSFGKARSVRGAGTLHLRPVGDDGLVPLIHAGKYNCFITQSPIELADAAGGHAGDGLAAMAGAWAGKHGIGAVESVWQNVGLRFGWNRHGQSAATARGRVPAARVILPGAVVRLESVVTDPDRLRRALLDGLGTGRDRGFGCLLPHPGRAAGLCRARLRIRESQASPNKAAIIRALDFSTETNLSASQIGSLYERLLAGPDSAKAFLEAQRQRGAMGYAAWSSSIGKLGEWVSGDQAAARLSLEILRDLRASEQGGE